MTELAFSLVAFLFPLAYSPGPGNMFFAANGARFGVAATLPANVGYHAATWITTLAIGLGFAAMSDLSPTLLEVIRWVGSAYVLYIAWKFLAAGAVEGAMTASPAGFLSGVALLLLNPKAYVIMALMFSQFLVGESASSLAVILMITTIFTLNNLLAFLAWTVVGDRMASGFRNEAQARRLNLFFGVVLALVAVWMMLR